MRAAASSAAVAYRQRQRRVARVLQRPQAAEEATAAVERPRLVVLRDSQPPEEKLAQRQSPPRGARKVPAARQANSVRQPRSLLASLSALQGRKAPAQRVPDDTAAEY